MSTRVHVSRHVGGDLPAIYLINGKRCPRDTYDMAVHHAAIKDSLTTTAHKKHKDRFIHSMNIVTRADVKQYIRS